MPWGKRKGPKDLEDDEVYAAEVERQMQMGGGHEQRKTFTQSQPQSLPNPYDKAEVKGSEYFFHIHSLEKPHFLGNHIEFVGPLKT